MKDFDGLWKFPMKSYENYQQMVKNSITYCTSIGLIAVFSSSITRLSPVTRIETLLYQEQTVNLLSAVNQLSTAFTQTYLVLASHADVLKTRDKPAKNVCVGG